MTELPKGFTCDCGREEEYPSWVFAHWNEALVCTCEDCGQKWSIFRGLARKEKNNVTWKHTQMDRDME